MLKENLIYEGLIVSQSAEFVKDWIAKVFYSRNQKWFDIEFESNFSISTLISSDLYFEKFPESKETLKHLLTLFNNLGWFSSYIMINDKFDQKYSEKRLYEILNLIEKESTKVNSKKILNNFTLVFEPKFDEIVELNSFVKNEFYHITPTKNIPKIKSIGIVPKSKEKKTSHPDRIYVCSDLKNVKILHDSFKFLHKNEKMSLIRLKLRKNNRIFNDINFKNRGYYVLKNIPPNDILEIENLDDVLTEYKNFIFS